MVYKQIHAKTKKQENNKLFLKIYLTFTLRTM